MAEPYLDLAGFTDRTLMPSEDVADLETRFPGWILKQLGEGSRRIDARLRKRYAVPFVEPYPEIVLSWLARLVTLIAFAKRGFNPSDAQGQLVKDMAAEAATEIKEAADAQTGLWDLPLADSADATAVAKGGCFVSSEASPWSWTDAQLELMERNGEH